MNQVTVDDIEKAYQNIKNEVVKTELLHSHFFSKLSGTKVFLKLESEQVTGSFKARGALNKLENILARSPETQKVVAASTGNHAAAVIFAAQRRNIETLIFAPRTISQAKLQNLKKLQVEPVLFGNNSAAAEVYAQSYAREHELPFLHPYNDPELIAGQGTIAVELCEQLKYFDAVFVPIGGGGLISGIASYLKQNNIATKIIGVQPANASEMYDSVGLGEIVKPSDLRTIADGTAGGLDPDTITFEICQKFVDDIVLVTEDEIASAVYQIYAFHKIKVEPAAALSVAAILKYAKDFHSKNVVAIISGNKLNDSLFAQLIDRFKE